MEVKSPAFLKPENKNSAAFEPLFKGGAGQSRKFVSESSREMPGGIDFNFGAIKVYGENYSATHPIRIQPKLKINQPNDIYEQEADAMAERVMRMSSSSVSGKKSFNPATSLIYRKCKHCEEEENLQLKEEGQGLKLKQTSYSVIQKKCAACEKEEQKLHRKESGNSVTPHVSPAVEQTLQSTGQPMDKTTRSFMEQRFGYDFGDVRIHDDALAHQSSKDIQALAYAHGNHVVFGAGQHKPQTDSGKYLLAHELTHILQQNIRSYTGGSPDNFLIRRYASPLPIPPPTNTRVGVPPSQDSFKTAEAGAYRIHQESIVHIDISLERGGSPPTFETYRDTINEPQLGGGTFAHKRYYFHVLDAIEYAVDKAGTKEELDYIRYWFLDDELSPESQTALQKRKLNVTWLLLMRNPNPEMTEVMDPKAKIRREVFERALRKKTGGRCYGEYQSPAGGYAYHDEYVRFIAERYGDTTKSTLDYMLTNGTRIAQYDHFDKIGNQFFEVKTGHESLVYGTQTFVVEELFERAQRQFDIMIECAPIFPDPKLIWFFDNEEVADAARHYLGGIVDEINYVKWRSVGDIKVPKRRGKRKK